ncbi:MAG: DUF1294 domain-containing protein [Oscillospiraceae bacterium]|jgi:uncharacterized membrane protein YsdA (DUF1294 family)|nr:DUF1294 domain-containing protein [Oscillospiraceae bacterium]
MTWIGYGVVALAIWNAVVFCLYGWDKRRARRGGRRVSEKTLLTMTVLMGGPGALLGMYIFRHKTRHLKFQIGVPLLLVLNTMVAVIAIMYASAL